MHVNNNNNNNNNDYYFLSFWNYMFGPRIAHLNDYVLFES